MTTSEKRNPKERIVGVVVAQPIKWAMKVLTNTESRQETSSSGEVIDSGDGVLCE
jgi:N-acetyltransferase